MKKIIITLFIVVLIGLSSSIISYAYFVNQAQIGADLQITTGTFGIDVDEGIDESLIPGEFSEYKYFNITNTGSLNQRVKISFSNSHKEIKEIFDNIIYELQFKDIDGTYQTVINSDINALSDTTLNYIINNNDHISFRSKITVLDDIDSKAYEQEINLRLNINAYQTNLNSQ